MIEVTDHNGQKHLLNPDGIVRVSEAGASMPVAWHPVVHRDDARQDHRMPAERPGGAEAAAVPGAIPAQRGRGLSPPDASQGHLRDGQGEGVGQSLEASPA